MQRIILHQGTGVILRVDDISNPSVLPESEDAWNYDGSLITIGKPYMKRDPVTGQIVQATTKDIIESGVGDADRALRRQELINAMDAMIADTLIKGRIKAFITRLRAYFDYQL